MEDNKRESEGFVTEISYGCTWILFRLLSEAAGFKPDPNLLLLSYLVLSAHDPSLSFSGEKTLEKANHD